MTKHLAANTIEPKFATLERQSKLDPFAEKLAGWLNTEASNLRCRVCVNELRSNLNRRAFNASRPRNQKKRSHLYQYITPPHQAASSFLVPRNCRVRCRVQSRKSQHISTVRA